MNEYVWSVNGVRRHLTTSQRAAVAVELLPELKKAAKERQRSATVKGNKTRHGKTASGGTNATPGKSRDEAADLVSVSGKYVSDAAKLKREAPKAFAEVKEGKGATGHTDRPETFRQKWREVRHGTRRYGTREERETKHFRQKWRKCSR